MKTKFPRLDSAGVRGAREIGKAQGSFAAESNAGDGQPVAGPRVVREPHNAYPRIYLRCVDPGTDCECWVVCAKDDPGAISFLREE